MAAAGETGLTRTASGWWRPGEFASEIQTWVVEWQEPSWAGWGIFCTAMRRVVGLLVLVFVGSLVLAATVLGIERFGIRDSRLRLPGLTTLVECGFVSGLPAHA